ncbi:hypothetical protein RB2654_15200 [Rhodobacterales bacterium HTCC2654]|uniref:Uncharacterized protein n=1 Tax=Maritimibacter alkaliphilus HTCC2654 TaxID=314271 RepID=A3VH89_9RHOB|nr:hypothetical protein RB2654_15200 [Rhodobacterales bacterium HTCC2654] [Maritimibacter alkaliphilus HTCC2654]
MSSILRSSSSGPIAPGSPGYS